MVSGSTVDFDEQFGIWEAMLVIVGLATLVNITSRCSISVGKDDRLHSSAENARSKLNNWPEWFRLPEPVNASGHLSLYERRPAVADASHL